MSHRVKIVSWNLAGYTRRSARMADAWKHLDELEFDIALLQEAIVPPELEDSPRLIGPRNPKAWSYVYVPELRGAEVDGVAIEQKYGRVAAAEVTLSGGDQLMAASVHTYTEPLTADNNDFIFQALSSRFQGIPHVIGGDLNSARAAEGHGPGWVGHLAFFEGVADRGLTNCVWEKHGRELPTFFGRGMSFQDDHIFASTDPELRVISAEIHDYAGLEEISDHVPIEVEVELS